AVALVLPAHDVGRIERAHRAEHLVLLVADRLGLELRWRLHRREGEDLEEVRDDHVAERASLLVEPTARADRQRLRHVDLDVIDEVAVPDRLEEAVGEPESEDVEGRLLAEEVVDAKDLLLGEDLVDGGVQLAGALEVPAER